jgi:SAM-dependent methyltransferase
VCEVSFEVGADAYGRFMGRYSGPLAPRFAVLAGLREGQRALDVGCGTGVLTAELVARLGAPAVSAIDPSESFVEAVRQRLPDVDVRRGAAEALPFPDGGFDCALAQLVVHFMTDPVVGLSEMARVTRPMGVVAACVWDHAGGSGPLSLFWRAVLELDPQARDESGLAGAREGHLAQLFTAAGLREIESSVLTVRVRFANFDVWWEPFTLGVGPAGDYVARLDATQRDQLRAHCARLLPRRTPFDITASAWAAYGRA